MAGAQRGAAEGEPVISELLNVLLVEDSESDAALVVRTLRKAGYDVREERVETSDDMRSALHRQGWDVVICDYHMPKFSAQAALALAQQTGKELPFIVVSGAMGEDVAVAMMKAGAHDYLMKDKLARLAPAVARELRDAETRRERKRAEEALHLRLAELEAVNRVSTALRTAATPDEMLPRLLAEHGARLAGGYHKAGVGARSGHPRAHSCDRRCVSHAGICHRSTNT